MVKLDLHTHSILSHDGGISLDEYSNVLLSGILDCIAITDHDNIQFAHKLRQRLGERIIVGQEIKTREGEMIGLFLQKKIPSGLSALETAKKIRQQRGLVYIPHPFETKRSSMQQETLTALLGYLDIIEAFNARGFLRGKAKEAARFASQKKLAMAASSDSHSLQGLGSAFSVIEEIPLATTLVALLQKGKLEKRYAPFYTLVYPKLNQIRKILRKDANDWENS